MSPFAKQLNALRLQKGYSMQALAELANVSKSMICKIEQDKVQPTLDVAARLAYALGKTLSEMLHIGEKARVIFIPAGQQPVWHDADKVTRKLLSPAFEGMTVEWLQSTLPPHCNFECMALPAGAEKYLFMLKGELQIEIDGKRHILQPGDSFYFEANHPHRFINSLNKPVEYYCVIKHAYK